MSHRFFSLMTCLGLGNDVRFTVLSNRDHYILDTYENQELYAWFLEHVRAVN